MFRFNGKNGFTLIELIVTMAVSGIFTILAFNLYSTANYTFLKDKNKHDVFFDYNVKKSKTIQMLRNHPGSCEKQEFAEELHFSFKGDSAEILNENLPFKPLQCKPIDAKRYIIYFQGYLDSATHSLAGFSTIVD